MANNRCFSTFTPEQNASDYMNTMRQKTLYNEVNSNVKLLHNANPKKKNGYRYNHNFGVRENRNGTGNISGSGCLAFANNYQLLLDITKGKTINDNQSIGCVSSNVKHSLDAPVFNAWVGSLYSVNYSKRNVSNILNVDPSQNIIVDPSHVLFYDPCGLTVGPIWFKVVDISFNNTELFIEANRSQILHGIGYPEVVKFGSL
jgi:hypothetical protein